MKIVVTGASGLIGSALVASLRADGHDVRRLVRRAARAPPTSRLGPGAARDRRRRRSTASTRSSTSPASASATSAGPSRTRAAVLRQPRRRHDDDRRGGRAAQRPRSRCWCRRVRSAGTATAATTCSTSPTRRGDGFLADVVAAVGGRDRSRRATAGVRVVNIRTGIVLSRRRRRARQDAADVQARARRPARVRQAVDAVDRAD